jgi:carbonic anhydrase/acetyltransferase-like protein (isoleucine patch superfamily)
VALLYEFEGKRPVIAADAWVAPTATLIGDVTVESGASVWYGAVLRGDDGPIVIKANANVQDNSVLHSDHLAGGTEIGEGATVGHLCMVHSTVVEAGALIGNGATVLNGSRIGAGSIVAAGSVVTIGTVVRPGVLVTGAPAAEKRQIAGTPLGEAAALPGLHYLELARRHRGSIVPID